MALVKAALETKLTAIFAAMRSSVKTDAWMAEQIASEIKNYILTGLVSTVDTGATPAGSYAGKGTGTMTIDNASLGSDLTGTFEAKYSNDDLAAQMAADIHAACTASDTVITATAGAVTTPVGASSPFSGTGKGTYTGNKTAIETTLKACFTAMNNMTEGGDDFFAAQLAAAVDTYLKAGAVNVTLQDPLTGSGMGKIA